MSRTISTYSFTGVTLSASDNPLTISAGGGVIYSSASPAIYGAGPTTFTIFNSGLVGNNFSTGIELKNGGSVNNAQYIGGKHYALIIAGLAGTVTNSGHIQTSDRTYGDISTGIRLSAGGSVSNSSTGLIEGYRYAIDARANPATVTNAGTITNHNLVAALYAVLGNGIYLGAGGQVTNSGSILVGSRGVSARNQPATVINSGKIQANVGGVGIFMQSGGMVTNNVTATITGDTNAVAISGAAGTMTNYGMVKSTSYGISMTKGGSVTNKAGGTIKGGVYIAGGAGTLVNAGSIGGLIEVSLAAGYANQVQVAPGAVFGGTFLRGGNTVGGAATSSLVLLSGASTGTLSGLGHYVTGFYNETFASGAAWKLAGNTVGIAGGEVFSGFAPGDMLQITGVTNETVIGFSNGTLSLGGTTPLSVLFSGLTTPSFVVQNDAAPNTTDITLSCFAAGTAIATPSGPVAVEALRAGDRVVLHDGGSAPIEWIGHRHVACSRHPRPEAVWPVRVAAGAFDDHLPRRDLWLSPDHAVFVDGVLVPIKHLINGGSIRQVPAGDVTYYHLALPRHEVLLAEGLPAESYLETGGRSNFTNGGGPVALHADFAARVWEAEGCARLVVHGPELLAIRRRLNERGGPVRRTERAGGGGKHRRSAR